MSVLSQPEMVRILLAASAGSFLCGVALMYLVMIRTHRKRAAEAELDDAQPS